MQTVREGGKAADIFGGMAVLTLIIITLLVISYATGSGPFAP